MELTPTTMQQWYQQPLGAWLLSLEEHALGRWLSDVGGDHLVQIGGTTDLEHVSHSPIAHRFSFGSPLLSCDRPAIYGDCHELPLRPNSIDVMVLVHALEFSAYPVKLLQETIQVLAPGGYLFILGFNPWSLWGIYKALNRGHDGPWPGKFWSRAQVKRWLMNYDYTVLTSKTFCYQKPRHQPTTKFFMESLGQLLLPAMGSVYLIVAQKRVAEPLTKRVVWRKKQLVRRRVVEPAPRV